MGLFAKLLRTRAVPAEPPQIEDRSTSKPRAMWNRSCGADKENVVPVQKGVKRAKKGKTSKGKKKEKAEKNQFWKRKKAPAAAPKLSLFLAQIEDNNGSTVVTGSMTASFNSKIASSNNRLHAQASQISGLTERGNSEVHITSKGGSTSRLRSPNGNCARASASSEFSQGGEARVTNKNQNKSAKGEDLAVKETEKLSSSQVLSDVVQLMPLLAASKRPSTPYPSELKSEPKKIKVVAQKATGSAKLKAKALLAPIKSGLETEANASEIITTGSSTVAFDDLDIGTDAANEDLISASDGSIGSIESGEPYSENLNIHFTNLKQLPLFSLSSSENIYLTNRNNYDFEKCDSKRSPTGELASIPIPQEGELMKNTFGSATASSLQDIIDDMEEDMKELKSIFKSSETFDDLQDDRSANRAESRSRDGWIANGALCDESCASSGTSNFSFNSEDFAEDDFLGTDPVNLDGINSFEMTTIIEENEDGSQDPLEAALKKGELLSAGEFGDDKIPALKLSILSDLSDSFSCTEEPAVQISISPKRQLKKTISWKAEDEVFTFKPPFKVNLEKALEMVRSYDPKYKNAAKPKLNSKPEVCALKRSNAQRPLKSILKSNHSFSHRTLNRSLSSHLSDVSFDDTSLTSSQRSRQSSLSTFSSTSTSESVQRMVAMLKKETERRRKKLTDCRGDSQNEFL